MRRKSFSNLQYIGMKSVARIGRAVCVRDLLLTTNMPSLRYKWINELWDARLFLTETKVATTFVCLLAYSQRNSRVWYIIRNAFKNSGIQLCMLNRPFVASTIKYTPLLGPFLSSTTPRRMLAYFVNEYKSRTEYYNAVLRCAKLCSLINEITFGGFFIAGDVYTIESFDDTVKRIDAHKRSDIITLSMHAPIVLSSAIPLIQRISVQHIAQSIVLLR